MMADLYKLRFNYIWYRRIIHDENGVTTMLSLILFDESRKNGFSESVKTADYRANEFTTSNNRR